jgi:hypothetical protein
MRRAMIPPTCQRTKTAKTLTRRAQVLNITYIQEGWLYLAGHKDLFTGEIVGLCHVGTHGARAKPERPVERMLNIDDRMDGQRPSERSVLSKKSPGAKRSAVLLLLCALLIM